MRIAEAPGMNHSTALAGLLAVFATSMVACADDEPPTLTSTAYASATPPAMSTAEDPRGETRWLLLDGFDPGVSTPKAWRSAGFDLDHARTTAEGALSDVGTCKHLEGAAKSSLEDGEGGIDNSFGNGVMGILRSVDGSFADLTTHSRARGDGLLLRIHDLGGVDDAHAPGTLWVVRGGRVVGDAIELPDAYVAAGTWVGNAASPVGVRLSSHKVRLDLALSRSILAVDLGAGTGTLAGAVPVAPLAAVLGSEESRLTEYRVLPDMVPGFADVSLAGGMDAACDAVSFGAKLTAASTALRPTTLPSAAPSGLPEIGAHAGKPGQKVPSSAPSDLPEVDGVHEKE